MCVFVHSCFLVCERAQARHVSASQPDTHVCFTIRSAHMRGAAKCMCMHLCMYLRMFQTQACERCILALPSGSALRQSATDETPRVDQRVGHRGPKNRKPSLDLVFFFTWAALNDLCTGQRGVQVDSRDMVLEFVDPFVSTTTLSPPEPLYVCARARACNLRSEVLSQCAVFRVPRKS
jgi:hypothetical protein